MPAPGTPTPRPRPASYRRLVAAAVLVAGGSVLPAACAADDPAVGAARGHRDASPSAGSSPSTLHVSAQPAVRSGGIGVPEAPVAVRLPSGVVLPVRPAPTRRSGLLDVPPDPRVAGWWPGGSRLGDPFGATLLAAHVDSTELGLGPYAEVLSLRRGQVVEVRSRHRLQRFAVASLRLVPQGPLGGSSWIYSAGGPRRLVLVTCAGPYVKSRGGYQNLAVATARPLAAPTRRGAR